MSRPAILRDGYPVSSLRNEGEFIVTNPPEYAAGSQLSSKHVVCGCV